MKLLKIKIMTLRLLANDVYELLANEVYKLVKPRVVKRNVNNDKMPMRLSGYFYGK